MSRAGEIKEALRSIVLGRQGWQYFNAEVVSTNGETSTIKVGSLSLTGVRNAASANGDALNVKISPTAGSTVLVADLSGGEMRELAIIAYSKIDSIVLDGGSLGGLVKGMELKTQLDKMSARIDGIADALKNSATAAQDGGAVYKAAIVAAIAGLDKEDFANIESEKYKI